MVYYHLAEMAELKRLSEKRNIQTKDRKIKEI